MSSQPYRRGVVETPERLLTLRLQSSSSRGFRMSHLLFGLACTWVVGVWLCGDYSRAGFLQHLGVGSVIYVFILAGLLWCVARPLRPKSWTYRHVLTFVAITSPPAALYAIPVEMLYGIETARGLNLP